MLTHTLRRTILSFNFALWSCGAVAQLLTVEPALELKFATHTNLGYSLLQSVDLDHWLPAGSQIFGTGTELSRLVPASSPRRFYTLQGFQVRDLNAILEQVRATHKVPALAAAVVVSNRIVGTGAVGLRKWNITNAPVTLRDKWHHGSLTKSMTATLAAMLVEEGRIRWTNSLADIFPGFAGQMHENWRRATLEQLTSNRGGAPENMPADLWTYLWNFGGTPWEARRQLLERMTVNPPTSVPGTRYEYSNAGFSLAGHMLEEVMGITWENLLRERLFVPLEMSSAGFGVPATPRHIDHPWGHTLANPSLPPGGSNAVTPMAPGTSADNPPAIGPAGTVHCSLADLAAYCAFHLAVHKADTEILSRASGLKLHTAYPNNGSYAHGWLVVPRPWANGDALTHAGSNNQWYSVLWLAPARDFAVVALCNMGGNSATAATDAIAGRMIQEFLP